MLEAGTEAEVIEDCCLLARSACFFIQKRQPAEGGTFDISLGPSTSTLNQENIPTDITMGQSDGGIFSIKGPSSQINLA